MTTATLTGHVTYRTREALPPVTLVVELHDLSVENKEAKLVASTSRAVPAWGSLSYSLAYDPAALAPTHSYALSAKLYLDDHLFKASEAQLVIPLPETKAADIKVVNVQSAVFCPGGIVPEDDLPFDVR